LLLSGAIGAYPSDTPSVPPPDFSPKGIRLGAAYPSIRDEKEVSDSISAMQDLGLSCARLGCDWSLREPEDGRFYWTPLAYRLQAFADADIPILLTLETHDWPAWLPSGDPGHGDPETLAAFRRYVRELLSLFGEKIHRIQVGNEWNWEIDDFFGGSEEAFIAYANILADEVRRYRAESGQEGPAVVLGSFAARHALAYDRGLISGIRVEGRSVWEREIRNYGRRPPDKRMAPRVMNVLANAEFEILDIHFYDDYQDWGTHLRAFLAALEEARGKGNIPVIASEYGGPYPLDLYPVFGVPDRVLLSRRLPDYIRTLDSIGVAEAYFFKLQQGKGDIQHPDSFLIDSAGKRTPAYYAMKEIANF